MRVVGAIPARFGSTRFPGKPLALLAGKPLLQWVIEAALKARSLDQVVVATDDPRIADLATSCGVRAVMTDSALPSGSDRINAAISDKECDIVVNIQGDEPLIAPEFVDQLVAVLRADPDLSMATLAHPISAAELANPNAVKVVLDYQGNALYFSRFPIPYSRNDAESLGYTGCLKHIGLYAYRRDFLKRFCDTPVALIEKGESLEQLRALYMGAKIRVLKVQAAPAGVDTPEDLRRIEEELLHGQKK